MSYRAPYKEISLPNNLLRYIPAESVTRHIIRLDLRFNQIATFYPEDIARGRQILFIGLLFGSLETKNFVTEFTLQDSVVCHLIIECKKSLARPLNEVTLKTKAPNVKELVLRGNLLKEINLSTVRLVRLDLSENQLYAFTIDERKRVLPEHYEFERILSVTPNQY